MYPDPEQTLLSDAFAGTAAMKGCLYPFKLSSHRGSFGSDTFHGCFTNATTPALGELDKCAKDRGQNVRVSVLVNIAPPVPSPADLYKIKHSGSWASASSKSSTESTDSKRRSGMAAIKQNTTFFRRKAKKSDNDPPSDRTRSNNKKNISNAMSDKGIDGSDGITVPSGGQFDSGKRKKPAKWRDLPVVRRSFRVQKYAEIQMSLQRDRNQHVEDTKLRLHQMDPQALYVPLAPDNAPDKTALNDASALPEVQGNIDEFLGRPEIQEKIINAAARILENYKSN